jgi:hypothetical protein
MSSFLFFGYVIRTSKSLRQRILTASDYPQTDSHKQKVAALVGIYNTRIFGLVFYRQDRKWQDREDIEKTDK